MLIKHGLASGLIEIKCGGSVHGLSPDFFLFIVNNYYDKNVSDVHCLGSHINLRYRDIPLAIIPPNFIELSYSNKSARLIGSTSFINDVLFENFLGDTFVGDTTMYFALRDA